ncbi:chemotaxis-specific methylesterase [Ectopseudomonas mendocina]|jgi:two-component system response regulator WspF|uniref:chemotaxis response regulator protein-glutamate methylesterase n=1 Tax=Ectopseudomonas mendocina TaxID=300 RepID=UPI000206DAF5|nr:chemotaxis response regulator protein-glutamate methylesterase [Pseudomonas mendocina]MBL0952233.1 chemotaxis response regulator protein-glutamate methylesterase [Pseudomonas sp.]AEB60171.1 chemotaxis-specific methylesterase [Pseudomonas mendocina NK-01]MDF2074044.1 chemotaxis response regulator protein-glutamate methylesterase [Pseudomonas mendocina]SUD35318.1 chemotaxis-specific methylesterase [Pseudomonas mendocina]VEE17322.1 chemotaxis-specific methylesterase [Pseudomonas mendocina]
MRIAIANDMPLAVEALRRALAAEPEYQLIWVASNGEEAVSRCREDRPELLLMDMLMPGMDGVEATRQIMNDTPCAILIVTSDVERNMSRVFDAMGAGALDVVAAPSLGPQQVLDAAAVRRKIHNIAWMIGHKTSRSVKPTPVRSADNRGKRLVAIGASAGGPASLVELLRQIPADFPASIVLVQHVDEVFAAGMAQWLGSESNIPVRLAREGEVLQPASVLLAGTNNHLYLAPEGRLVYRREPVDQVYRPSIDVFFESVATHWRGEAIGVLLTGMGRDGARGLKLMRERGFHTIAQDQASSAVYGMPKAAVALDAATEVLPLDRIPTRLIERLG